MRFSSGLGGKVTTDVSLGKPASRYDFRFRPDLIACDRTDFRATSTNGSLIGSSRTPSTVV